MSTGVELISEFPIYRHLKLSIVEFFSEPKTFEVLQQEFESCRDLLSAKLLCKGHLLLQALLISVEQIENSNSYQNTYFVNSFGFLLVQNLT